LLGLDIREVQHWDAHYVSIATGWCKWLVVFFLSYTLCTSTRVWTWVIGQTGIKNLCMLISFRPCLSDNQRPYPSTSNFCAMDVQS